MQPHITLTELQHLVKATLAEKFTMPLWISAEIADCKVNYSGHCYLELVEKGGDNGVPLSQTRAVIWSRNYRSLAESFERQTGQRLAAGIQLLAKVTVTYHEIYGFSLQIIDIDPAYTLGDMERQRQQTITQLQKEGVWDMNRETEMPIVVQHIAVISSANAAGYQDFCKELNKYDYAFDLRLFDAFMQGAGAEDSIVAALCAIAETQEQFDVVVLIRGGGSTTDLNCFNTYRLCSYIAQFPLPVLTGIGHDKDTSVADMVAHTPLKTPTAVAGWIVERASTFEGTLDYAALRLHDATVAIIRGQELRLERLSGDLTQEAQVLLSRQTFTLANFHTTLTSAVPDFLARQQALLISALELVESRSPQRILKLGFAIVRSAGQTVTAANNVKAGDTLHIELANGTVTTIVKETK
ncbi:MAG: exodeoxyribonuclease VII large subunit [Alistipes sp.]